MKESSQTVRHSLVIDPGMDKLQELLLAMAPGDVVSVARATEVSGSIHRSAIWCSRG